MPVLILKNTTLIIPNFAIFEFFNNSLSILKAGFFISEQTKLIIQDMPPKSPVFF